MENYAKPDFSSKEKLKGIICIFFREMTLNFLKTTKT
jgi:hypothetical protein